MTVNSSPKLTPKQRRFCEYYLETGNAAEAVIKAGYRVIKNGVPDRILAKSIGCENLTKPYLRSYIQSRFETLAMSKDEIKVHLFFLIRQFADLSAKNKAIDTYFKLTGQYKTSKRDDTDNSEVREYLDRLGALLPK